MKKVLKVFGYSLFLFITVFLLLEICYRFQVIDFYSSEWKLLNKKMPDAHTSSKRTMLILGDSYSAGAFTYIDVLRDSFPNYSIYNAAIPGTGIRQTALIASKRIKEVNPDVIIYQIYVGNDLSDIKHPTNWSTLSFSRNCYWWLSDRFLFLHYLNYSSGQYASHNTTDTAKVDSSFSVSKYNAREKVYIQSDPFLFENAITLKGENVELFKELIEKTKSVFEKYISAKKIYFVLVPENFQVNKKYYENMTKLGCRFNNSFETLTQNYLFLENFKKEFGNQVIDPLPFLKANDASIDFYFANDPHLTEKGQISLGNFLVGELKVKLK